MNPTDTHQADVPFKYVGGVTEQVCRWREDPSDDSWDTACDNKHTFLTDGPVENRHKFCPYCGRRLKVTR